MYTSFFGLNEKPFTITPDPRYLFMSERHGEGLAHLVYGVTESGGFIQLTGEVGTGKTTLVRTLLGQIPAEVDIALILNPQLTALEFLAAICEELGVAPPEDRNSAKALVDALNRYLLEAHSRGRRIILLVDEAQNLSEGVLEQLRLLTNLETARQKLLQIILIAQPELRDKLAQESLRQLAQRVTGRYHLEPLSREETSEYIDHRLRVAGALTEIFEPRAKREVHRLSGGVPRIINVICDRALLGAYSRESRAIDKRLVRKAASEVAGAERRRRGAWWLVAATLAAVVIAGTFVWFRDLRQATPAADVAAVEAGPEASGPAGDAAADTAIAADPPATPAAPDVDLDEMLAKVSDDASFAAVLALWGVSYDPAAGSPCAQAAANGLRCYSQRGTWSTLRQLDRPVVLTLTDTRGGKHAVAVTALGDDSATVATTDGTEQVGLAALSDYWFGQFTLVWRPANGDDRALGPGMQSENVRWLRQSLAALDGDDAGATNTDLFDDQLERRVIEFQRRHRLDADGLAGQQTQIIINSLLARDDSPRLTSSR